MSAKSLVILVILLAVVGGVAGYMAARNASSADRKEAQAHVTMPPSFWTAHSPEQWKQALITPVFGQAPGRANGDELVIMAKHIETISALLDDTAIPEGSRFELGAGVLGLATVSLAQKGGVHVPAEKVPVIVQTAVKALKLRYDIARKISPPDALANLYFASTITGTSNNPAGLVEKLKAHSWIVDLQEATVALQQPHQ